MSKNALKKLNKSNLLKVGTILVLSLFLVISLIPRSAQASSPCWNCHPDDPDDWFLGQIRDGAIWEDPVDAEKGDEVFFTVYYHNNVVGTTALNPKIRIYFSTDYENPISLTAYLSADNAETIEDILTINLDSPQKLQFSEWALWYPNGILGITGSEPQYIPVNIYEEYLETELPEDIKGCYEYRGHLMFQAVITEEEVGASDLSIRKTGRNLTQSQTYFQDVISANPSDRIEFKIEVVSTGTSTANNVTIKDNMPSLIGYEGNLKADGVYMSGDIFSGLNLGSLVQGQSKDITFETRVASEVNFPYGTTSLVNSAQTWADEVSQIGDTATVNVYRSSPPPSSPGLSIDKLVKNITNNTGWLNSVSADPLDRIEFKIQITSLGSTPAYNVIVKDFLPAKMTYRGNLKINWVASGGDILGGFNLGSLSPGVSKTITFEGQMTSETNFSYGTTTLVNQASVRGDGIGEIYDSATLSVRRESSPQASSLSISKKVKNQTKGQTSWYETISAKPSDKITFKIVVTVTGDTTAYNITVKDGLPDKIAWQGDLEIDGKDSDDDITKGIDIGDLSPGQSKTITFDILLDSKEKFIYGTTNLINTALAYNVDSSDTDTAKIRVVRKEVAGAITEVPTGVLDFAKISLFITILLILGFSYLFLVKSYISQKMNGFRLDEIVFDFKEKAKDLFLGIHLTPEERSEKRLSRLITGIKKQEGLE